jgi:hypothetical protein
VVCASRDPATTSTGAEQTDDRIGSISSGETSGEAQLDQQGGVNSGAKERQKVARPTRG